MSWLRSGDWYLCREHDVPFPRGAYCPKCGPPPPPITLEDINERLIKIEKLLTESKDNGTD